MTSKWPLYPVTSVGSWPRSPELLKAMKRNDSNLKELQDAATLECIRCQEDAGVDIVTDGEQRRDNFYSFIADKLSGIKLMTMAELLDYVEDKAGFEELLAALDVPAYAIKNPTIVDKIDTQSPLVLDDYRFLRENTKKPIKVTLPGPYILCRSMWVKKLSEEAYPTRQNMADDIVALLRCELKALIAEGVDMVQFDEPVLTELVFTGKAATRTFMCAALAASASPEEELEFAVNLINQVTEGIIGTEIGLHICRGNWSQNEDVLLEGSYDKLIPHLSRMNVDQFVLEYATPRAGSIEVLKDLPAAAKLGFGIVNPRTEEIESPVAIAERVKRLSEILSPERIFLNPDCGFGTFAERPVATVETATNKLKTLVKAAKILRN